MPFRAHVKGHPPKQCTHCGYIFSLTIYKEYNSVVYDDGTALYVCHVCGANQIMEVESYIAVYPKKLIKPP